MSIVFVPKIGDHLRKTEGVLEAFSKGELAEVLKLRASGLSYRECGLAIGRGGSSVASAVNYYNLFDDIASYTTKEKRP